MAILANTLATAPAADVHNGRGKHPQTSALIQPLQTGKDGVATNSAAATATLEAAARAGRKHKTKGSTTNVADASPSATMDGTFSPSVQNLAYTFDKLNNLTKRQDFYRGVTEEFTYDETNQLSGTTCTAADAVTIVCDHLGNITSRSDVGTYSYGQNGAGPHAVTTITGTNGQSARKLNYNAVGNCVQDGDTRLSYNGANQPASIQAAAGSILFAYTPGRARLKRTELAAAS